MHGRRRFTAAAAAVNFFSFVFLSKQHQMETQSLNRFYRSHQAHLAAAFYRLNHIPKGARLSTNNGRRTWGGRPSPSRPINPPLPTGVPRHRILATRQNNGGRLLQPQPPAGLALKQGPGPLRPRQRDGSATEQRESGAAAGGSGVGGGDGDGGDVAGAAAGGVLRHAVPGGGDHRAGGGEQGRLRQPSRRRQPRPPPLPRLLRQGVRRLCASGLDAGQPGREGRAPEHEPPGLRGDRQRQDAAGAGMLRRRLLRRRPRLRRQGRTRPRRGQLVPGAVGPSGRQRVGGAGDERESAAADGEREPAEPDLREQGPDAVGHGGALRRAHHRQRALQLLRQPAVRVRAQRRRAGPQHGPVLPGGADAAVPQPAGRARAGRDGGHGPRDAHRLRHQLLRLHRRQARPARLRPGAPRRPRRRRPDRRIHQQPRHVPGGLRRRHGQDGSHRRPHRRRRNHPDKLQGRQLS